MKNKVMITLLAAALLPVHVSAKGYTHGAESIVSDEFIAKQREELAKNVEGKGFGPQSPRDIDAILGSNQRFFNAAPPSSKMNLCNIHFHKNAEHKGGEFTEYAGNGYGNGFQSGFKYTGKLSKAESKLLSKNVCEGEHGGLNAGDTVELHYVHTSAQVTPGPTLGACLSESIVNPQLRVETQVMVLVNDKKALNFETLAKHGKVNGFYQAVNIPSNMGTPVQYAGSTTGPGYNEKGSPLQVSWSVRPKVAKVNVESIGNWCNGNIFNEDHAHGVRNLVINPDLLSGN